MNFNNIDNSQLPNLVYLSLLLVLLVSSVVFKSHIKASDLLKQVAGWAIIILVILIAYSFRYDIYSIKDRVKAELFPSKIMQVSDRQIAISIANDGHFYADIEINQKPVRFMVDTGASDIVLNLSDAKRVGIDTKNLSSFRQYQTANGSIVSGMAKVDELKLAGIIFNDVTVSVNDSNMGTSLLGMSFLKRFKKYEFYQDRLVLTY
jgi:aspartyl protease family protein